MQCNLWVPAAACAELRQVAELLCRHPELSVARLVDRRTGKLCGLKGPKARPATNEGSGGGGDQ